METRRLAEEKRPAGRSNQLLLQQDRPTEATYGEAEGAAPEAEAEAAPTRPPASGSSPGSEHDNHWKSVAGTTRSRRRTTSREVKRVRLKVRKGKRREEEWIIFERKRRRKSPARQKSLRLEVARKQSSNLCHSRLVLLIILALAASLTSRGCSCRELQPARRRAPGELWSGEPFSQEHRAHGRRGSHQNERSGRHRRQQNERLLGLTSAAAERPVVATKKGRVRGITQKLFTGKNVDAFLGIPYAEPPVGKFRFRHPQPIREWPGELEASRLPNSCFQINDTFFGSNFLGTSIWNANTQLNEDCLYLNIWAPFGSANTSLSQQQQQQQRQPVAAAQQAGSGSHRFSAGGSPAEAGGKLKAVMVWIFGGGFYSGTSSLALYDGGLLASEEDVVMVSMNYRVSSLGFLYFGRPDAPGNAGLFDQLLALQWIHDNIDQFGGDPARVTIFGESAGAVSISLHMLSPLSRNLFSQAILQSGAATCPWGLMEIEEIVANGLQLAQQLNCPSNKSQLDEVMECLLRSDPLALVSQEVGQSKTVLNFPFVPVVDGSFLLEPPKESMAKGNFKPARLLLGSNYDEGNSWLVYMPEFSHCPSADKPLPEPPARTAEQTEPAKEELSAEQLVASSLSDNPFASSLQRRQLAEVESLLSNGRYPQGTHSGRLAALDEGSSAGDAAGSANGEGAPINQPPSAEPKPCKPNELLSLTREDFLKVLKDDFLNPYAKYQISKEAIIFEYSNWNNPLDSISNYDALDKIVGDYYFTCHVNEFAQRYANAGNPVYMYYFKQHSSISPWPKWMGVLHGDEISFVFGEPLNRVFNYTPKEVELSRRMMSYWANFAKYGNPTKLAENGSGSEPDIRWPEYSDKRLYFELHGENLGKVGRGPRSKQCAFWASYMPQLMESFNRHCPGNLRQRHQSHPFPSAFSGGLGGAKHSRQGLQGAGPLLLATLLLLLAALLVALLLYAKHTGKLNISLSPQPHSNGGQNATGSNAASTSGAQPGSPPGEPGEGQSEKAGKKRPSGKRKC